MCTCKGLSERAVTTGEPNIESKVFKMEAGSFAYS